MVPFIHDIVHFQSSIYFLKTTFVGIAFLFLSPQIFSQSDWNCPKVGKKASKLYQQAGERGFKGRESYELLLNAVEVEPQHAEALSALAYINHQKYKSNTMANLREGNRAKAYWEKAVQACEGFRNFENLFFLAEFHYQLKEYDESLKYLNDYVSKADASKPNELKKAKDMKVRLDQYNSLFENPVPFNPQLVKGATTDADEYLPMLSPDNQYLFYTRKAEVETKSIYGKQVQELFMQSRKKYDGNYSSGIPMPEPFNKGRYQGGASISVDNKLMFITVVEQTTTRDGRLFSNGDIYYSEFKSGKWSDLIPLGPEINGRLTWEGQPSISSDNQTLYFSSARGEDNYGGMDLYKSIRKADDSWGKPINLGPTINTSGNEKSPFIHSDSYTLYFSSDGHPGVGGLDIFFTKMDENENFSSPVNMGFPINSEKDENGFMVSTDGKYGYFSSNPENKGLDIYNFDLPKEARPEEVIFVKGQIKSKNKDAAVGMKVELKNTQTNKVTQGVVDEESGEYVAVITAKENEDVMMLAKKNGYSFTSQYIKSSKDVVGKPKRVEAVEFNPIEKGETYRINNINFATSSYQLNPQVISILNEFIQFLKDNPKVKVKIQGHTDNVGDADKNLILSEQRAKAVNDYLILMDIDAHRLTYEGYGEAKPISSNESDEGRALNRRTEFVIVSN